MCIQCVSVTILLIIVILLLIDSHAQGRLRLRARLRIRVSKIIIAHTLNTHPQNWPHLAGGIFPNTYLSYLMKLELKGRVKYCDLVSS